MIESHMPKIAEMLRANNMPVNIPLDHDEWWEGNYNCWSFTAYYMKWDTDLKWMYEYTIEKLLAKHTVPARRHPIVGDIVVFRRDGDITHTGILMPHIDNEPHILHKPGRVRCPFNLSNQPSTCIVLA